MDETLKKLARYPEGTFQLPKGLSSSMPLEEAARVFNTAITSLGEDLAISQIKNILEEMSKADALVLINALECKSFPKYTPKFDGLPIVTSNKMPPAETYPILCFKRPKEVLPILFKDIGGRVQVYSTKGDILNFPNISKNLLTISHGMCGFGYIKVSEPYKFLAKKLKDQSIGQELVLTVQYVFMHTSSVLNDCLVLDALRLNAEYAKGYDYLDFEAPILTKTPKEYEHFQKLQKNSLKFSAPANEKIDENDDLLLYELTHNYVATLQVSDGALHYRGFNTPTNVVTLSEIKGLPDNITDMYLVDVYYKSIDIYGDGILHLNDVVFIQENKEEKPADNYEQLIKK